MAANTPDTGQNISPGAQHYRAFIGAPQTYDIFSHMQFSLMTFLGLRQEHMLLDIGCGSLRGGKLFIPGIEPRIEHLASLNQLFPVQEEMRHYRMRSNRLERIESHPLYRMASRLRRFLRRR